MFTFLWFSVAVLGVNALREYFATTEKNGALLLHLFVSRYAGIF